MPRTLSEADSKSLLTQFDVPFAPELLATTPEEAADAAVRLGMPVAIKLCGENIAHKTERGLVRLGIDNPEGALSAATELLAAAVPADGATGVLVSPMIKGSREFIAGLHQDAQFGPTILFGVGGVMTEVLDDASIRLAPLSPLDATEMIHSIRNHELLGAFRGEPPVDLDAMAAVLMALSRVSQELADVVSIDLNPLIIHEGAPVAVDALVEVAR